MRSAYLETLSELAAKDKNVLAMISDNGAIVYDDYRARFPNQYINAGISEANMVGMAAGLARRGKIPFAYTIGAFLAYRAYEFIMNDVCLQNQNVKLVGIGAGCAYSLLGPSHHTIFDISALRPLPNLTVFSPASPMEVKQVVKAAYSINGPVYIRLGTNREAEIYTKDYPFEVGKAVTVHDGGDLTIISTGSIVSDALEAARQLEADGIGARVINIHTIKPFDSEAVIEAAKETGRILVVEEHSTDGGLGSIVADAVVSCGIPVQFDRVGLTGFVDGYGTHMVLKEKNRIGVMEIQHRAEIMVKGMEKQE